MEKSNLKQTLYDHILEITSLKERDVVDITRELSVIYITITNDKLVTITISEEEPEDKDIDYELEY